MQNKKNNKKTAGRNKSTDSITEDVLKNLKWLRKQRRMTQGELGAHIGCNGSNYGKIENGVTKLVLCDLVKICKVLDISASMAFCNPVVFQLGEFDK